MKSFKNLFILGALVMGLIVGFNSCSSDEEKKEEEKQEATAKDILKDGNTIVLKFSFTDGPKFEIQYKKENGNYSLQKALLNDEDVTSQYSSVCTVSVENDKIFKFYMNGCPEIIDTEKNTYTLTNRADANTLIDGKDEFSNFQCLVNETDIVPTLTYVPYVSQ